MKPIKKNEKKTFEHDPALSASVQPDDGLDPRFDQHGGQSIGKIDRKTAQLCAQVRRVLEFAVPEALQDSDFDALVLDVQPAPNTGHLLVLLSSLTSSDEAANQQLECVLMQHSGQIRTAVAQSIQRKKAPTLTFRVVPVQPQAPPAGLEPATG